jgi:S-adenosylmethionine uptake transporter
MYNPTAGYHALHGNARGILLIIVAMLAMTVVSACNKQLAYLGFTPAQMVFGRACVLLTLLMPHVLMSRGQAIRVSNPGIYLFRGVFIALSAYGMAYSVSHLPLAECNVYLMSCSLFMLPLGALFLGERAHWVRWVGVGVGFAGVLLILHPSFSGIQLGALAALGAALAEAVLGVCLKKLSKPSGACAIIFWSYSANFVVFGVLSGFYLPLHHLETCLLVLLTGLSSLCIFYCYILAYRVGEASAVEAGSFSLLLFSPLIGYTLFNEVPSQGFWLGALVMSCGILLVWFEPRRKIA